MKKYYVPMGTPIDVCFNTKNGVATIESVTEKPMIVNWPSTADSLFWIADNDDVLYMIKIKYLGVCERP